MAKKEYCTLKKQGTDEVCGFRMNGHYMDHFSSCHGDEIYPHMVDMFADKSQPVNLPNTFSGFMSA